MAHYIDKAALVAEIERIKKEECPIDTYEGRNKLFYFERFLSFINTLEVKDVDLDKIFNDEYSKSYIDKNIGSREGYTKGYDQAMQDIEEFFQEHFYIHPHDCHVVQYVSDTPLEDIDDFVEQFKNYMQDEM